MARKSRVPVGKQLRRLREQENVSRYYISQYMNVPMHQLSRIECNLAQVDDNMVDRYKQALKHVRRNSLPARGLRLIWSAPAMTEKL